MNVASVLSLVSEPGWTPAAEFEAASAPTDAVIFPELLGMLLEAGALPTLNAGVAVADKVVTDEKVSRQPETERAQEEEEPTNQDAGKQDKAEPAAILCPAGMLQLVLPEVPAAQVQTNGANEIVAQAGEADDTAATLPAPSPLPEKPVVEPTGVEPAQEVQALPAAALVAHPIEFGPLVNVAPAETKLSSEAEAGAAPAPHAEAGNLSRPAKPSTAPLAFSIVLKDGPADEAAPAATAAAPMRVVKPTLPAKGTSGRARGSEATPAAPTREVHTPLPVYDEPPPEPRTEFRRVTAPQPTEPVAETPPPPTANTSGEFRADESPRDFSQEPEGQSSARAASKDNQPKRSEASKDAKSAAQPDAPRGEIRRVAHPDGADSQRPETPILTRGQEPRLPSSNRAADSRTANEVPKMRLAGDEGPQQRPQTAKEIALRVTGGDATKPEVDIRLIDRAGNVHVSVRTADQQLTASLREQLGDLVAKLEQKGYRAETLTPADSGLAPAPQSARSSGGGNQAFGQPRDGYSGAGQDRNGQRQQPRPQWLEELERTAGRKQDQPEEETRWHPPFNR